MGPLLTQEATCQNCGSSHPGVSCIAIPYDANPTITAFHWSDHFVRCILGPYGSGKSTGCVKEIGHRSERQKVLRDGLKRTRWAVIRNTYGELKDTTIKTWLDWFPPEYFGKFTWNPYPDYLMEWMVTACQNCGLIQADCICDVFIPLQVPVRSEILFRALDRPDHVRKIKSLEITGYWINEAREVPKAIKDDLDARCGRYPSMRDGGPSWYGGILDSNPWDTDHPLCKLFEDAPPHNHRLFRQPDGLSDQAENTHNLPGCVCPPNQKSIYPAPQCQGRKYYHNLLPGKSEAWIKVYVRGQNGFVMDGKPVYPEYNPSWHDSPVYLEPVPGIKINRGWDYGLTPATILFQCLPGPKVNFLREICSERAGADAHSDAVIEFCATEFPGFKFNDYKDWDDPAGHAASQTDEKSCVDILNAKKIYPDAGAVDFASRHAAMVYLLTKLVPSRAAVQIDPRCKIFKKALAGGYHFKRIKIVGEERYHDEPDKNHPYSDIANAAEYPISKLFNVPTMVRAEAASAEERARSRWREQKDQRTGKGSWATV